MAVAACWQAASAAAPPVGLVGGIRVVERGGATFDASGLVGPSSTRFP